MWLHIDGRRHLATNMSVRRCPQVFEAGGWPLGKPGETNSDSPASWLAWFLFPPSPIQLIPHSSH